MCIRDRKYITGCHGERIDNGSRRCLIDFATFNNFRLTDIFFPHKEIYKYTWQARVSRSAIHSLLVNRKLRSLVEDTRVFRGCDVESDHFLLILKICIPGRWRKARSTESLSLIHI